MSMPSTRNNQNYMNTLIFSIVAKAVCVIILGSLIFEATKPYIAFLLTVVVGLLLIIIAAMYAVITYNNELAKKKLELADLKIINASCPDYYKRDVDDNGNVVCLNDYNTPDNEIEYKFVLEKPEEQESINTINIDTLFNDKNLKDTCETQFSGSSVYTKIPWTSLKPQCPSYDDSSFSVFPPPM